MAVMPGRDAGCDRGALEAERLRDGGGAGDLLVWCGACLVLVLLAAYGAAHVIAFLSGALPW